MCYVGNKLYGDKTLLYPETEVHQINDLVLRENKS